MIPENVKTILKKQHYGLVGRHSAVQICRWAKKSLRNEGVCYKEKFYGIKSHLCCQMTPSLYCPNQCLHCWRAIEFTTGEKIPGKQDSPKQIIDDCIKEQRRLLLGFKKDPHSKKKQLSIADQGKYLEAQEPMQFAISLSGEPTIYTKLGELIAELRKRGKTSFLVTNGLYPEKIRELLDKKQLPTQLYVSINIPNEKNYQKFHRSSIKNAWKKLNQTLDLLPKLKGKTRTVFRINLIKGINMNLESIREYAQLILRSKSDFIEVKSYMAVGFARNRLGYNRMPFMEAILAFAKKIEEFTEYKIEDQCELSRVVLLVRDNSVKRFISKADL